jgi:hypothetical protein
MNPLKYSKETQFCLALLQRENIPITESLANSIETRHRKGLPTGYTLFLAESNPYIF